MRLRHLALAAVFWGLMTVAALPSAFAQGDPSTPIDEKPVPIDTYPLPSESGAIRYSLADRWDHTNLTFFIHNCPTNFDCNAAQNAVRNAFNAINVYLKV